MTQRKDGSLDIEMGEGREGRRWERGGGGQVRGHVCKRDKTSSFHFDWQAKGGLSKAPRDTTPLPPSLSVTAITLSLGHHSLSLALRLYHTLHHPLLPPSPASIHAFHLCHVFSFLPWLFCSFSYILSCQDTSCCLSFFAQWFLSSSLCISIQVRVCFVFPDFINTFLCESEGKGWFDTASATCNNTVVTRVVSSDPVWQKRKSMSFQVVRQVVNKWKMYPDYLNHFICPVQSSRDVSIGNSWVNFCLLA